MSNTSGNLLAMPIIIYNLGVEMVYVLLSRLKAQGVDSNKSKKGRYYLFFYLSY
jgi:hypothetical protein